MYDYFLKFFFIVGLPFMVTTSMAVERTLGSSGPPLNYRIDEVKISVTLQPGSSAFPVQRVILAGSGGGTAERDGKPTQFPYSNHDLIEIMSELYRIRFFDLPAQYTTRYSVMLKNDGHVQTTTLNMKDTESTVFCFAVAKYEKCVTLGKDGPFELKQLAEKILSRTLPGTK